MKVDHFKFGLLIWEKVLGIWWQEVWQKKGIDMKGCNYVYHY